MKPLKEKISITVDSDVLERVQLGGRGRRPLSFAVYQPGAERAGVFDGPQAQNAAPPGNPAGLLSVSTVLRIATASLRTGFAMTGAETLPSCHSEEADEGRRRGNPSPCGTRLGGLSRPPAQRPPA